MENPVFYVPVPVVCSGQIVEYKQEGNYYYVKINDTFPTMGALACQLIHHPGGKGNYKIGDRVKVMVTMSFGGVEMKYQNVMHNAKHYIIGLHNRSTIFPLTYAEPFFKNEKDYAYFNRSNDTGMLATDDGMVILSTRGATRTVLKPFGHGIYENMMQDVYQNYHRIISHNEPYASREYFGLYKGKDQDDKMTKIDVKDFYLTYKRFVTQTIDPGSWVSTCEGTWSPWVGPNNDIDEITKNSNILYTKIINSGSSAIAKRITIEAGEEGPSFYNFRIDQILTGERLLPTGGGATPAISGNKFKCLISEEGEVEVRAASKGISLANFSNFKLTINKNGDLIINAKGKILISHGDTDTNTCSVEFDGKGGIDIKALGGLKVNGKPIVSSTFIEFWLQHAADLYLSSAPGSPSPINPAVLPLALKGGQIPATTDPTVGGFFTSGIPVVPPITGIQVDSDYHATT